MCFLISVFDFNVIFCPSPPFVLFLCICFPKIHIHHTHQHHKKTTPYPYKNNNKTLGVHRGVPWHRQGQQGQGSPAHSTDNAHPSAACRRRVARMHGFLYFISNTYLSYSLGRNFYIFFRLFEFFCSNALCILMCLVKCSTLLTENRFTNYKIQKCNTSSC